MHDEGRIRELVDRILELECAPEEVCAGCPELLPEIRRRLERIRRVEERIDGMFPSSGDSGSAAGRPATHGADKLPQIDGYEIEGLIGRGGMGVVYKAKHLKLNRLVALKMLLAGSYASPVEVTRFVRESQAVAELQHPHIVQVHDVGDVDGNPYFTMEFVAGGSLAQELAGVPQSARSSAQLIATIARAVHSAHSKGIIHRDLKPANILLTGEGAPKIADFGLARHVDGDPRLTMTDARLGTPSYMAPEQALGRLGKIGPSVDIYALGAMLYETLTGRPPFRAETAIETQRQVVTVDAVPPSRLNASVSRDLETICLKCLEKDPSRRYPSAAEMADDLDRFLNGQPVHARRIGVPGRIWRWGKRNKQLAAALSGVLLLLISIVVGSIWDAAHFRKLEGEQRRVAKKMADLANDEAELVVAKETERQKAVDAEKRATELHQKSEEQRAELRKTLYLTEMNLAGQAATFQNGLVHVTELLENWGQKRPDQRGWEWYYLHGLSHRDAKTWLTYGPGVHQVVWSPNGTRLASAEDNRTVCIRDAASERPPLRLYGHAREVFSVCWSPEGQRVASASWDGTVRIWDATTGLQKRSFPDHATELYSVAWSPDGHYIASGGKDQTIHIRDAEDGTIRHVLRGHTGSVVGLSWHPDSRRLVSASHDATIRIWDAVDGIETRKLTGHLASVNLAVWSPDSSRLASASTDRTVRIWDPENGKELRILRGHSQVVTSVVWNTDGSQLASASEDQTLKIWTAETGVEMYTLRDQAPLLTVASNPKGDRLATGGYLKTIKLWDTSFASVISSLNGHASSVRALQWCQQGQKLCASADSTGVIKIWDVQLRKEIETLRSDSNIVHSVSWNPRGTRLAAAGGDGAIRIWSVATWQAPLVLEGHAGPALSVAYSPDGLRLASGGNDGTIRIWDGESGKLIHTVKKHLYSVYCVAWNFDGKRLASASEDRTVRVWDTDTGAELVCYRGQAEQVLTVAWKPDGTTLASSGHDRTIHLWDAATGKRLKTLRGHTTHVPQVIWSGDGARLASVDRSGMLKIWDTATGREAMTLTNQANDIGTVAWSPDGMILLSAGVDGQIRINDGTPGYVDARSPQLLPITKARLDVDPSRSEDWRLRAEIYVGQRDWEQAATNVREYLLLKPDQTWHLFDAITAGPYSTDVKQHNPPEDLKSLPLHPTETSDDENPEIVNWKSLPMSRQGIIDFEQLMDHGELASIYALFSVYSLANQPVAILVGANDQVRLWLNGELLYESTRPRIAIPDEDAIPATLKSGWNMLLIRAANKAERHEAFLRLSNAASDMVRLRNRVDPAAEKQ